VLRHSNKRKTFWDAFSWLEDYLKYAHIIYKYKVKKSQNITASERKVYVFYLQELVFLDKR